MNKKISYFSFVTFTLAFLGLVNSLRAQSPAAIPYQAVARGAGGNLIASQNISLRFTIHDGTAGGTVVYQETKSTTTNALGLFNVNIGQGTVVTGTFAGINWATGAKFTQVEIDVTGGTSYIDIGTQQMMSVPYALYAASSGTSSSNQWTTSGNTIYNNNSGNVGIGTSAPEFKLSLDNDAGIIAKGVYNSGVSLTTSGAGTRMVWYPKKSAFRVGTVTGPQWDDVNIGYYSTASGWNATASGFVATSIGDAVTASGDASIALGEVTTASGNWSTAIGLHTTASGVASTAIGSYTIASGDNSTAMGNWVGTNVKNGAFSLGDNSTQTYMQSSVDNEYSARFDGGYRLFSDATTTESNGLFFTGGKQGIGTSSPEFKLSLDNDGGILAKGIVGVGATLATAGVGQRMFWYPKKAAFRVGSVDGTEWDDANIGNYSIALGNSTIASANYSTALGDHTTASGVGSTALGYQTTASGQVSVAMGSWVSTNLQSGAFALGDISTTTLMNSSNGNEFSARFAGGYRLFSDAGTTTANGLFFIGGKQGIGTNTPEFKFSLDNDGGIIAKGTLGSGSTLISSGLGTRMIWYPKKAAFRAGIVNGSQWDDANIGSESTAFGYSTIASGVQSTALGGTNEASGNGSTTIGNHLHASGDYSTALGSYVNTQLYNGSFGIGDNSTITHMASSADDEFSARFAGGYRFFTDATTTTANGLFFTGGKEGIGTSSPEFKLSLDNDGGILAKGTFGSGASLTTSGAGTRMIWYPKKAAFRVGRVTGVQWNDANIGNYSIAMGNVTRASGDNSIALGSGTYAGNSSSVAIGDATSSTGIASMAMGQLTTASGDYSTAIGQSTTASGINSTAMGNMTTASGANSTAIGNWVTTSLKDGTFVLGDNSSTSYMGSSVNNEFSARFDGGYRLFSNSALTTGVTLAAGGGSWTSVSDRNKKENFMQINGEEILQKVGTLPVSNWNYKTQPVAQRHIGPMAQDFFAAFHLDGESDTTINSLDIDGVNMAAIQALKTRTDELKIAVDELKDQKKANASLRDELHALKAALEKNGVLTSEISASAKNAK